MTVNYHIMCPFEFLVVLNIFYIFCEWANSLTTRSHEYTTIARPQHRDHPRIQAYPYAHSSNTQPAMHELFLTAAVPGEHVKEALKILQGLCAMSPVHKFERVLTYEGPPAQLVPIPAARVQNRRPQDREVWNELNKQLVRQSHYITLAFAAEKGEFGAGAGVGEDQAVEKP